MLSRIIIVVVDLLPESTCANRVERLAGLEPATSALATPCSAC
jgi:hypothetical protein